jgi:hypothetical protein
MTNPNSAAAVSIERNSAAASTPVVMREDGEHGSIYQVLYNKK